MNDDGCQIDYTDYTAVFNQMFNNNNNNTMEGTNMSSEPTDAIDHYAGFPTHFMPFYTPVVEMPIEEQNNVLPYSDEGDDDYDETGESSSSRPQKKRKRSPTVSANGKRRVAKGRGRPGLTEAEKEDTKKKRELEREQLEVFKEVLTTTKTQSTTTESLNEGANRLLAIIATQQEQISGLNHHFLSTGIEFRNSLCEADKTYREEKSCMQNVINHLKDNVRELNTSLGLAQGRVSQLESESVILKTLHETDTVLKQRFADLEAQVIQAKVDLALASERETRLKERIAELEKSAVVTKTALPVVVKAKTELEQPSVLYRWDIVESDLPQCLSVYGFGATQLKVLYKQIGNVRLVKEEGRSKRGCKTSIEPEVFFLMFMYFMRHYTTMRLMSDKFQISTTQVQGTLLKMITTSPLFPLSTADCSKPTQKLVYRVYFLVINKPLDSSVAVKYYSALYKTHGIYIHCLHNQNSSGKVIEFYTGTQKNVDRAWLKQFSYLEPQEEEDEEIHTYEERMKSKFAVTVKKYRGNLTELPAVIECVIALTNFDIEFKNPIEQVTAVLEMSDPDED